MDLGKFSYDVVANAVANLAVAVIARVAAEGRQVASGSAEWHAIEGACRDSLTTFIATLPDDEADYSEAVAAFLSSGTGNSRVRSATCARAVCPN